MNPFHVVSMFPLLRYTSSPSDSGDSDSDYSDVDSADEEKKAEQAQRRKEAKERSKQKKKEEKRHSESKPKSSSKVYIFDVDAISLQNFLQFGGGYHSFRNNPIHCKHK